MFFWLVMATACSTKAVTTSDSSAEDLEARIELLEAAQADQAVQLDELRADLYAAVAAQHTDEATIEALREDLTTTQGELADELDALDVDLSSRVEDLEGTSAALVPAVEDLQGSQPATWSATGTAAAEGTTWSTLASVSLELTSSGPIVAWCSSEAPAGELRIVLTSSDGSTDRELDAVTGTSTAGVLSPGATGTWWLQCEGRGGPWAAASLVAVQVPAVGG